MGARDGSSRDPYVMANSECIWWYGHDLQTHVQSVLIVFRITGDLTLLDHIDEPPQVSSYSDWTKWHFYMGRLTGNASYTIEARRMSDVLLGQLRTVRTPRGDAYVWRRSNPGMPGGKANYLSPTTYVEFVFANAVEFHLEGFHVWADPVHVERFARTITQFVMDDPDPTPA